MNRKPRFRLFLEESYLPGSCHYTLQIFLRGKEGECSEFTLDRLYYNLFPLGRKAQNPLLETLSHEWLREYIEACWLRYAPETMRTLIGDVRQFFRWAKKKKHHSQNIAKGIRPVHRRRRRRGTKGASEADIKQVMEYLANQLKAAGVVYRDLFGVLQSAESDCWTYETVKAARDLFAITFLYETGARAGELSKLGSATMREVIKHSSSAYAITLTGKTNDRDYLFTRRTAELWQVWQRVRPEGCGEYAVIGWGNGHPPGKLLPNGISHMLVNRCNQAGARPFRAHALRHAKVKRSRQAVGLEMASLLIDHSDISTTRGYSNIDDDELAAAAVLTGLQFDVWG